VQAELGCQRSRCHVMSAAECGKEVIQCGLVRDIDGGQLQADFVLIAMKQVVVAHSQVKQVSRLNALWIVVVIFRVGRGNSYQTGSELCRQAITIRFPGDDVPDRYRRRRAHSIAYEHGLKLLIGSKGQAIEVIHQSDVARKGESGFWESWPTFWPLVI
jgi:hypothetical protein